MSKYFELMQALREAQRDSSPRREPAKTVSPVSEADRNTHRGSPDFDRVAQEECLKLVQQIFLGQSANPFRAIVFAGIDRGDGCSRICVEAARTLAANTSGSVCLVDANFRTPSLPGFLGVTDDRGLADSLIGEGGIRSFAKQLKPSNLWLLSGGTLVPESPLGLECPFRLAQLDVPLGNPELDVLGHVELRMVPSQDFLGPITEDSLCSDVPARHSSLRSEHDDGVFADALNHQA